MSNLVEHAKYELSLISNDQAFNDSIIKAVESFASYGHSGGSAGVAIQMLHELLQSKNLTPLTDNPKEWVDQSEASGVPMWQSTRCAEAFSDNGGRSYYLLSERDVVGPDEPMPIHFSVEFSTTALKLEEE